MVPATLEAEVGRSLKATVNCDCSTVLQSWQQSQDPVSERKVKKKKKIQKCHFLFKSSQKKNQFFSKNVKGN